MRKNNNYTYLLIGLLTIVFITLKLCHIILWSWIWVLSPLWLVLVGYILLLFVAVYAAKKKREWDKSHLPLKSKWEQQLEERLRLRNENNQRIRDINEKK